MNKHGSKERKTTLISFILALCIILGTFAGCGQEITDKPSATGTRPSDTDQTVKEDPVLPGEEMLIDLMEGVASRRTVKNVDTSSVGAKLTDFAVRLFKECGERNKNTLVSPLSVMLALAMTANGADGETLRQMENVLGFDIGVLNEALALYRESLPQGEKYKFDIANAIWFKNDKKFSVDKDFLQNNADWYDAGIFSAPFDETTLNEINGWVSEHTNGMIDKIVNNIPEEAVMYLVNALAFQAEWDSTYNQYSVHKGEFTLADGTKKEVEFMYSEEQKYLSDENAVGFIKYFKDHKYAFAALLPDKGVGLSDYIDSLTGEKISALLASPQDVKVNASIPKFSYDYDIELSEQLKKMGMPDAFDADKADFGKIGTHEEGNLFISSVIHKTFIEVSELGTKAGAATVVELACGSAYEPDPPKEVYLDRPFVYMLIDCETNTPFFIGSLADVG